MCLVTQQWEGCAVLFQGLCVGDSLSLYSSIVLFHCALFYTAALYTTLYSLTLHLHYTLHCTASLSTCTIRYTVQPPSPPALYATLYSLTLHLIVTCSSDYCPFPNTACIFSFLYFPLLIWFASFLPSPSLSPSPSLCFPCPLSLSPSPSLCFPCPLCLPCSVQMLKLQRLRNSCRGNGTSSCILCGHDFAHHRSRSPTSLHFCHECAKVCVCVSVCVCVRVRTLSI